MKYLSARTSFSSVKMEISVAIEITNCPHNCQGCHTPELQEDIGHEITPDNIMDILKPFMGFEDEPLFTCIAFMGGEQHTEEFISLVDRIKERFPSIKICLYTAANCVSSDIQSRLDYLKVGKYVKELGGVDSPFTNQKFIILGV